MSDENVAGHQDGVGAIPEDYAAFEAHMQPTAAAQPVTDAKTETAADTDAAGDREGDPEDGDGSESAGEDQAPPEDSEESQKPAKKGGWQRKIEKAERRAEEAERRLAAIEGKLADKPAEDKPTDKPAENGQAQTFSGTPEPVSKDFESYEAFTKALAKWQYAEDKAQEAAEQRQTAAKTQQQQVAQKFLDRAKEVAKLPGFEDFDEVVKRDVTVSGAVQQALFRSEQGPQIAYYFGQNPAEAERISALDVIDAAREIGKLETRFAKTSSTKKPPVSDTPDPITPSGARHSRAATRVDDPNIAYTDFEKQANARFSR